MRLQDPKLPFPGTPEYERQLQKALTDYLREVQKQVNQITEGQIAGVTNAATAAPTTGRHQKGDVIRNSNPTESGGGGSMYIIFGWECVTSGEPGTWRELRCLTGN